MHLNTCTERIKVGLDVGDAPYALDAIQHGLHELAQLRSHTHKPAFTPEERAIFLAYATACAWIIPGEQPLSMRTFRLLVGGSRIGKSAIRPLNHQSVRAVIQEYRSPKPVIVHRKHPSILVRILDRCVNWYDQNINQLAPTTRTYIAQQKTASRCA